jgi:hypothetical protein
MIYSKPITINYAVVKDHMAIGEMNIMEHLWHDIDRRKTSVLEQNLSHGHKPTTDRQIYYKRQCRKLLNATTKQMVREPY